jgi:hypothetical protein
LFGHGHAVRALQNVAQHTRGNFAAATTAV